MGCVHAGLAGGLARYLAVNPRREDAALDLVTFRENAKCFFGEGKLIVELHASSFEMEG